MDIIAHRYCDCFANGEFCHMCNCNNCSNNLGNEEERQRAIKSCLERNPNAFRPKIGKGRETGDDIRRHNKGCNCKRSGCLKNYCECYEVLEIIIKNLSENNIINKLRIIIKILVKNLICKEKKRMVKLREIL